MPAEPLLSVQNLRLDLLRGRSRWPLVEDVDLSIGRGEAVGLVGESGCGKSVTALAIMRLLPRRTIEIAAGRIAFDGVDLAGVDDAAMRGFRGNRISMIFQEPMTSLHPMFPIGRQISEGLRRHRNMDERSIERACLGLLDQVGIGGGRARLKDLPGDLSGGQRQRVMIAMALACEPDLLIADEPTTALDVTIQAQVMRLLDDLRSQLGLALLLISHDLNLIAAHCDRTAVMYAGRVVENAPSSSILTRPRHRYTAGLASCTPRLDGSAGRLPTIAGLVPPVTDRPPGCRFRARCDHAVASCVDQSPDLAGQPHAVACWNPAA